MPPSVYYVAGFSRYLYVCQYFAIIFFTEIDQQECRWYTRDIKYKIYRR